MPLRLIAADCVRFCEADPTVRAALPVATLGDAPRPDAPVVICHSPSRRGTKGTGVIDEVVRSLPAVRTGAAEWRIIEGVSHAECMRLKQGATIFVDQLEPSIGGFGVSALEAMGLGAACLASMNHVSSACERSWPRPPIIDVQDAASLRARLEELLASPERLFRARTASYAWARDVAAAAPCAERLDRWLGEALATEPAPRGRRVFPVASPAAIETSCAVVAKASTEVELASLLVAIESAAPIAQECVVVLDDRSLPEAQPTLEAAGARVVPRRWTDDFAAARNAAQAECRGDWIFVIDSDEMLVDIGNLREAQALAIKDDHGAVALSVRAIGASGPDVELIQARLYRRDRCTWRYAVHNELQGARTAVSSTARIDASYVGTLSDKIARSLPLLLAAAEREPGEARWAHYIAHALHAQRELAQADEWAERCLALAPAAPLSAQTWAELTIGRLARGTKGEQSPINTILRGLSHQPEHPDLWHTLAMVSLVEWFRRSQGPRPASVKTARFAPNLPSVASALGMPMAFGGQAQEGKR